MRPPHLLQRPPGQPDPLHKADELAGEEHREQRIADALGRDVAEGEPQHRQVEEQVDPLQLHAGEPGHHQGQGVVPAGGAAGPHRQPHPQPHEDRAGNRRQQRLLGQLRPQGAAPLAEPVEGGEAAARRRRAEDEAAAQQPPAQQIAQQVEGQAADRRREAEPILQQQGEPQHAALGDAGQGVDIVQAECQDRAAEQGDPTVFRLEPDGHGNTSFRVDIVPYPPDGRQPPAGVDGALSGYARRARRDTAREQKTEAAGLQRAAASVRLSKKFFRQSDAPFFLRCAQEKREYCKWERALMVLSHALTPSGEKNEYLFRQTRGGCACVQPFAGSSGLWGRGPGVPPGRRVR